VLRMLYVLGRVVFSLKGVGIAAPPLVRGKAEAIFGTRLNRRHRFSRAFGPAVP
jgi:hypothetical protein